MTSSTLMGKKSAAILLKLRQGFTVNWKKFIPDKLVAVGNVQKSTIEKTYGIPDKRMIVIRNGVEQRRQTNSADFIKKFNTSEKVIVGSISTLIKQKGISDLLDVAHELKKINNNFIFVVAGDGYLKTELEHKCQQLGLQETVIFLGWVEDAAARVLPSFDIFFQPSLWEAMSIVLLEAMAAGKAIIATDVGENIHVLKDSKSGYLVKPKDITRMVTLLNDLINNKQRRIDLGKVARQEYEKYFTVEKMLREYENLYQKLLQK